MNIGCFQWYSNWNIIMYWKYYNLRCCQILISAIYEDIKTATTTITLFLTKGELSVSFGYTQDPKT